MSQKNERHKITLWFISLLSLAADDIEWTFARQYLEKTKTIDDVQTLKKTDCNYTLETFSSSF